MNKGVIVLGLLLAVASQAAAQEAPRDDVVTRQAIIRQLTAPREEHRGLVKIEDPAPGDVTPEELTIPSIEFRNIEFALGSSELTPAARAQLDELGAALVSEELRTFHFEIIGHTDARGSPDFNQRLSQRRAIAVRDHLVRAAGVNPRNLEAVGRGMDFPSRPDDPYAAENRRVEIRNRGPR